MALLEAGDPDSLAGTFFSSFFWSFFWVCLSFFGVCFFLGFLKVEGFNILEIYVGFGAVSLDLVCFSKA